MDPADPRFRIVEAAGEVFAERGFADGTIRDICQRAGANVAAVNYYFGDKQRLYVAALKRAHQWRQEAVAHPDWPADAPAETRLAGFVLTFLRRVLLEGGETWHTRLLLRALFSERTANPEVVQEFIRPQFDLLVEILRDLVPPGTDETKLRLIGFSVVGQCLHYRFADPIVRILVESQEYEQYTPEALADHITRFTLAALANLPE